ncbi:MAG: bacteriohemerythrin [Magnetococcales bacterium]|nr:bacteriohemerythrin [Magnetococcales bacterium]
MTLQTAISWDDTLRTKIPSLDDDHKKIIQTINIIIKLIQNNGKKSELSSATRRLMFQISSHLRREERFLEQNDYPMLAQHKKEHNNLLNTLIQIKDTINTKTPSRSIKTKLYDLLINRWLIDHIMISDMKYADFFNNKDQATKDTIGATTTLEEKTVQFDTKLDNITPSHEKSNNDEIEEHLKAQLQDLENFEKEGTVNVPQEIKKVDFKEEISVASNLKQKAQENVKMILDDIAADRPVEYKKIAESAADLFESFQRNKNAMLALALIQDKDSSIFSHCVNVATYLMAFSLILGFDEKTTINIGMGGMLHDIGMAGLNPNNNFKQKPTLAKDKELMGSHVNEGLTLLKNMQDIPQEVMIIAGQHHEKIDGTGYPNGLSGGEIHIYGKMAGIVNEFERLTSYQYNKAPISSNKALKKILKQSKNSFDAELIQMFIKAIGIHPIGTVVELRNGCVAVVIENDSEALLQPVVNVVYNEKGKRVKTVQTVDLKSEKKSSARQIKRVTKIKNRGFDPMDALLGLRANAKALKK